MFLPKYKGSFIVSIYNRIVTYNCKWLELKTQHLLILLLLTVMLKVKIKQISSLKIFSSYGQKNSQGMFLENASEIPHIRSRASIIRTEFPRMTHIPMVWEEESFLYSIASSMTRFINGSKPRSIPSTLRPNLNVYKS